MKHDLDQDVDPDVDRVLMRLLHGELPPGEADALRARLRHEPELAAAWERLEALWEGIAAPPAAPVPPGFTGRVMAHVRQAGRGGALASGIARVAGIAGIARVAGVSGASRGAGAAGSAGGAGAMGVLSWAAAPGWLRASCAAALLAGLLLGAGLGVHGLPGAERAAAGGEPGLSESYWVMVESPEGLPALPPPARGEVRR